MKHEYFNVVESLFPDGWIQARWCYFVLYKNGHAVASFRRKYSLKKAREFTI